MLLQESLWIKNQLRSIVSQNLFPVLNIGSSTSHFRRIEQPHIQQNVFSELENRGRVVHLDIKKDEGVDVCGDLNSAEFVESLKSYQFKTVTCNNLMMHLEEQARTNLAKAIENVLEPGGYLIISTSYKFPYTPDPYDSYYRPGIEELRALFPSMNLLRGEIVQGNGTFLNSMVRKPKFGLMMAIRLFTPFYHFRSWKHLIAYLPDIQKKYSATCLLLQKG